MGQCCRVIFAGDIFDREPRNYSSAGQFLVGMGDFLAGWWGGWELLFVGAGTGLSGVFRERFRAMVCGASGASVCVVACAY